MTDKELKRLAGILSPLQVSRMPLAEPPPRFPPVPPFGGERGRPVVPYAATPGPPPAAPRLAPYMYTAAYTSSAIPKVAISSPEAFCQRWLLGLVICATVPS